MSPSCWTPVLRSPDRSRRGRPRSGPAREALASEQLHAPHLIDSEVASALRRRTGAGGLTPHAGWTLLDTWRRPGLTRHPVSSLLERVWASREDLSAHDASCVALAEALSCGVLTADARPSRAPGLQRPVTVVPR